MQVDADTYALAYTGDQSDGFITTFTISADGTTITEVTSLEHDTVFGRENSLVQVDSDTYALAYEGNDTDGFITTFTISGSVATPTPSGGSGDQAHKTRPTFGLDHNTFQQLVEGGFSFNGVSHDITHNFWTPFEQQPVKLGESNSFSAKVFAQQKLRGELV